jgi:alginate O-acetyltransferase complex protein AlgI
MLFNSIEFLIFLPFVILVYYLLDYRIRWLFLLTSSYYFYMSWNPKYVLLLLFFTLINYFAAQKIDLAKSDKIKKYWLYFSLISSFSLLFVFKYFNFVSSSVTIFLNQYSMNLDPFLVSVLLPVGISFYTFQTIGYVLDVYWGKIKPEKHFGIFALYVSYFPQLVAGPIERASNLLPQLRKNHKFDLDNLLTGIKIMLWGFFLKLVIGDRLAIIVNYIYNDIYNFTGLYLFLATYFFSFQIFCDFAGYSFIAIGSAKIMGVNLMENFRRPYLSKSIQEFWQRWHISLSTWFKDYLYIPMGGNRVSINRFYFNIFIVFLVSGIWHGANWTFFIWGALHGFYLILGNLFSRLILIQKNYISLYIDFRKFSVFTNLIKIFITFNLVSFSWIFFRANNIYEAWYIVTHLLSFSLFSLDFGVKIEVIYLGLLFLLFLIIHDILEELGFKNYIFNKSIHFELIFNNLIFLLLLLFGIFTGGKFIYFQF